VGWIQEIAVTVGEIIWTPRELVGNAATTFATAEEIVFTIAAIVWALAEVPANVPTTSSMAGKVILTVAGIVFADDWLVLTAKTIVSAVAAMPAIPAKPLKNKGNPAKTVNWPVCFTTNQRPPTPKPDKVFFTILLFPRREIRWARFRERVPIPIVR
jgi:hypothetical protein